MVSAPLIVFLYDRTFVAGSFREAWRRRQGPHLALASTWIVLAWLVAGTGGRGGTAGLGGGISWSRYVLTQAYAILRYLRLAVWPHPLVFDYGAVVATGMSALLSAVLVGTLLGATLFALRRNRPAGFLGAAFFAILAPTALVPVTTQTIAEHRMYLPLAAVLAALVLGLDWLCAQGAMGGMPRKQRGFFILAGWLAAAVACAAFTVRRNAVYGSEVALWTDTIVHWPVNARAHLQLGDALHRSGRVAEAEGQFRQSLALQPSLNPAAHYDLGSCLLEEGRLPEAIAELGEAVLLAPGNSDAHNNLGNALAASGRLEDAMAAYHAALAADPANVKARGNLAVACYNAGNLQAAAGRLPEAMAQYREALRLNPAFPEAEDNLGNALWAAGRLDAAVDAYRAALRLRPDYPRARDNLEKALRQPR